MTATVKEAADRSSVKVASLGLFILDTFEWRTSSGEIKEKRDTVIGGGGTYAIIGSRIWLPPTKIGVVVDRGNDWEEKVQTDLDWFGPMWHYREQDRPTTRALNLYTGEHRDFEYLNERTRLEPVDLPSSLRSASQLHCVCSPTRLSTILSQLTPTFSPSLVYEPIPFRCIPDELAPLRTVLPKVGVFSPNHEEAWGFYGVTPEEVKARGKAGVEEVAKRFFEVEGATGDVVIRSGAWGAFCWRFGEAEGRWVDAYHTDPAKVVDVTGAGNTFLGGLMAGLELQPDNLVLATQMGAVAASFTIEQFGLPTLSLDKGPEGEELWNGASPHERLRELQTRAEL